LNDYGIDPATISFGFENVHVVKDQRGNEIADIETEEENAWLLRACLDLAFRFTSQPDATVFFSIAGGRKTMSACLMVAAQLYGRPRDRVYHVLVSPEFESSPVFFYPPRESALVQLRDPNGHPYFKETRYAAINLLPIPFVSVRDRISDDMLLEPHAPAELMLSLVREEPPILTIDIPAGKIIYQRRELDMMPARLALYAFFALLKKGCPLAADQKSCRDCTACYVGFQDIAARQQEIADLYRKATHGRAFASEMSESGIFSLNSQNFNSYKNKIQRDLERGFGAVHAQILAINASGRRPDTRYGIALDRESIRVVV
jgi:CRISPR-associated protein Csx14